MNLISLNGVSITNNTLNYKFSVSDSLKKYFSDVDFVIEYPINIENVPLSVLAIPFVCNVLPIIWLTDSTLELDELDSAFYNCIPIVKQAYVDMYPNANLGGKVIAKKIIDNSYDDSGKCAMFYSGGLDSAQTLISHYKEKPLLLSVWGSDVAYDNTDGWRKAHRPIVETADKFSLNEYVIHSTFRKFDNEGFLEKDFSSLMGGDGYWHAIKYSLALLGHVAPLAYIHKLSSMYFASSFCKDDVKIKGASVPSSDNNIAFCGCKVHHDGFDYSRQDKIHNLVRFCKENNTKFKLHVCWQSNSGENCCHCEKCFRTMLGIWVENANPKEFGFYDFEQQVKKYINYFIGYIMSNEILIPRFYPNIQKVGKSNLNVLKTKPEYKYLKWFFKVDFKNPDNIKLPIECKAMIFKQKAKSYCYRIYTKIIQ